MLSQFISQVTPETTGQWSFAVAIISILSAAAVKIFLSLSAAIRQLTAELKSYKESQNNYHNRLTSVVSMILIRSLGDNEVAKREVNAAIEESKEKPKQGVTP